ncbi:MAG: hypothetical protein PHQ98_03485 [Candidatus ainarchaeum sp.]|nr:hypothetical protein [Candidatus ainarchaeum sp.]
MGKLKKLHAQGTDLLKKGQSKFSVCNFVKLHGQGTIEYLVQPFFKKAGEKSFHKWNCAQGTIEYLVLLAVVLIVALLGVFLINGLGNGEAISVTGEKLLSTSSGVSVVDAVVDGDGNGLVSLSNQTGQGITIKSIGGSEYTYFLPTGESVVFSATELDDLGCKCNGSEVKKVCVVPVTYEDSKGIPKTESIKIEMSCVESEFIDFSNAVSPGTIATSGGGGGTAGDSSALGNITPVNPSVPTVVLLSPVDGNLVEGDNKLVSFNFSVLSDLNVTNCKLNIAGIDVNELTDVNQIGNYSMDYNFVDNNLYSWKITCQNSSGIGTSTTNNLKLNYYEITNCQQLQDINKNLKGTYKLMNNIDCIDTRNWNDGNGWDPIGFYYSFYEEGYDDLIEDFNGFNGMFNGNNKIISDLYVNRSDSSFIGLFGKIEPFGKIYDLTLTDVNINGNFYVGGLVGTNNEGTIDNVIITGNLNGKMQSVGGIAGENLYGLINKCSFNGNIYSGYGYGGGITGFNIFGNINQSKAKGTFSGPKAEDIFVSGSGDLGGIAGSNNGTINNSFFLGVIDGGGALGGIVGGNDGDIINCYSVGDINGNNIYLGGLVGSNYGAIFNSYSISNVNSDYTLYTLWEDLEIGGLVGRNNGVVTGSFSAGKVVGNSMSKGLIGAGGLSGETLNSYWDVTLSLKNSSSGGIPKNTTGLEPDVFFPKSTLSEDYNVPMQHNSILADDWDFDTVWQKVDGNYPILKWQVE